MRKKKHIKVGADIALVLKYAQLKCSNVGTYKSRKLTHNRENEGVDLRMQVRGISIETSSVVLEVRDEPLGRKASW